MERREACKGGKELSKKSVSLQPSSRSSAAAPKHTSNNARRTDTPNASVGSGLPVKTARPSSSGGSSSHSESEKTMFEQQVKMHSLWKCLALLNTKRLIVSICYADGRVEDNSG